MADRPILFSAPMIRALLGGRKTQTRRLIKFPGVGNVLDFVKVATDKEGRPVYEMKDAQGHHLSRPAGKHLVDYHYVPPIGVGDRLWVRESVRADDEIKTDSRFVEYLADEDRVTITDLSDISSEALGNWFRIWSYGTTDPELQGGKGVPSIHMPRWASRITLIVADVRVERLQAISEEDAIAEGCSPAEGGMFLIPGQYLANGSGRPRTAISAVSAYDSLWQMINGASGPKSWDANPWIVAYTFSVHLGNIDQIGRAA